MRAKLLVVGTMAVTLSGCAGTPNIPWDGIVEWTAGELQELIEDHEDEPEPPSQPSMPIYFMPEWAADQVDPDLPPGIVICTPCYVPGQEDSGGSIAVGCIVFTNVKTGEVIQKCWSEMKRVSPDGAFNWRDSDGTSNCVHTYTTAHRWADEAQTIEDCPKADGTRRGAAICRFKRKGEWNVDIHWRSTTNRTTHGWLGITTQTAKGSDSKKVTAWYRWNQQGSADQNEGYVNLVVAETVRFKR